MMREQMILGHQWRLIARFSSKNNCGEVEVEVEVVVSVTGNSTEWPVEVS